MKLTTGEIKTIASGAGTSSRVGVALDGGGHLRFSCVVTIADTIPAKQILSDDLPSGS